jgi:signal transduction histidine kinase
VFRSIKSQILLVTATLVLVLLSQVFLSGNTQSTFVENLDITQEAVIKVSLVRELERDVIDLQRNVLIYKASASRSAVIRFNLLMRDTQANLTYLEKLTAEDLQKNVYLDYVSRMRVHLSTYDENFSEVIIGRTKRQTLYENGFLTELENVFLDISSRDANNNGPLKTKLKQASFHIAKAESFLLQYLLTPEQSLLEPFQQQISQAKSQFDKYTPDNIELQNAIQRLDQLRDDFLQLTQVTRGYLFLVNVVMAGSANEFLFLARELNRLVTEKLSDTNMLVKQAANNARSSNALFSAFAIGLAATTALFLVYRIMVPINTITQVFQRLAKGKNIKSIPGLLRKDEIGQLAQAADVFHEKNQQTTSLLKQSQLLNTQQEALNLQLVASNQKAEQATVSKSMFLANMSHEIRTPMNGIIGMLDVVMRSDMTIQQREQLDKVAYSGQILMSLINDILDFSKVEAGKLNIENIEFSVHSIFTNILENITHKAKEKNLNLRFHVNPDLPCNLLGDPLRISQVMLNLCSNAIKFTRNGSVSINIDYEMQDGANNIRLLAEVMDSGIGMSTDQKARVFDTFTQADGSTSRNFGGTGLGLSIVKQLVTLMGGDVSVESELTEGSVFKVSFLLKVAEYSEPLLQVNQTIKGKLYYFSKGQEGLLHNQYIEKLFENHHHYPLAQLPAVIENIRDNDAVIIDVEGQAVFKTFREHIESLYKRHISLGFVTNTQPSNIPDLLKSLWRVSYLSHPFTPAQVTDFFTEIVNKDRFLTMTTSLVDLEEDTILYRGHVLLVEDNLINQAVAGEMLKLLGLTFDIAEDGYQAVTMATNSINYDMLLMDIQMPVMDGYEATLALRKKGYSDLIICGLSANAMKQDFMRATEVGMNDYITKPIKKDALEKLIARYLPKADA